MNNILSKNKEIIVDSSKTIYVSSSSDIRITNNSKLIIYSMLLNTSLNINVYLDGEKAEVELHLSTINYDDNNIEVNVYHNNKNTISNIFNHGVNAINNRLNFNINGYIPKESIKSICNQDNQIINIKNGKSTILPKLFIDQFDSLSSHSAYIGKFKDSLIFYLESRGISRINAYKLLIKSFLVPLEIEDESHEYLKNIDFLGGDLFE